MLIAPAGEPIDAPGNHIEGGVIVDTSFIGVSTQYVVRMPWGQEIAVYEQNTGARPVMAPGTVGLGLHGGATPFDPAQYYVVNDGRLHCGLVAVQWCLVDHPPGSGFVCVPGSHKAAFAPPETAV